MCGIVGYIGKQKALPILLDGLKALEYRGYDSAGVAVLCGSMVKNQKNIGRVHILEENLKDSENFFGTVGIAHTRWATHGNITEMNAHPHRDCMGNIWLAHNGIIENYKELKNSLIKKGHSFYSETDTEVIPHLIEEERNRNNAIPLEEAVRRIAKKIRGTYGLVIIDVRDPQKLIAVRNFSPLLLGVGENEYIIASDASAVLKYTKQIIYLNDGEMVVLEPTRHRIFDLNNNLIVRTPQIIDWSLEQSQKSGYPHFMLKEIMEQAEAIENSTRGRLVMQDGLAKLGGFSDIDERLRKIKRMIIVACGTSYFSGLIGKYMLEEYAGISVEVDLASEFRYRKRILEDSDAILAISQSGETADTLEALREAKQKGILTLGIVNSVGSTISRETEAGIYQHIGPEIGVASTKAFTSQVAILALLTLYFGRNKDMSLVMGRRIGGELQRIPELIQRILKQNDYIKELAKKYQTYNNFFYLGRKYNLPSAYEGALKLKEISYVHAEGYGAGEMKHGPIAVIDKNFPSVVIAPSDSVYEKVLSNLEEIKARGGLTLAIATENNNEIKQLVNDVIYIPKTLEMLTPILSVIPLQLFAYHFGVLRGSDVDKPRNLAKSVTVE